MNLPKMTVPGKPRRVQLDFVRGIAILMVMAGHFRLPHTGTPLDWFENLAERFGGQGINLFFVLSGFLVGGLLLKEYQATGKIKPGRFLLRRIFKIWPGYYFLILVHVVTHHHPFSTFFWQNVLNLQNYLGSSLKQTWTLAIEEHFYIVLAFLLAFVASRKWPARRILTLCVALCILAFLSRTITAALGNYEGALHWTQNRIDSLLFGVILALLYYMMPAVYSRMSAGILPLVAAMIVGALCVVFDDNPLLYFGPGLVAIYVAAGAFLLLVNEHSGRLTEWWLYRAISWIGIYSYALYLWHSSLLGIGEKIIARYPPRIAWPLSLSVQFFGALTIAFVATHVIEWPFLKWRESIPGLRDSRPLGTLVYPK
jgi:peptidoglycan/LPS O-acetylase OafA/YrhL